MTAQEEVMHKQDSARIRRIEGQGHTYHCACRLVWGDGKCECGGDKEVFTPASQVIEELKLLIEEHGDLKVRLGVNVFEDDDTSFFTSEGTVTIYQGRSYDEEYIILSA